MGGGELEVNVKLPKNRIVIVKHNFVGVLDNMYHTNVYNVHVGKHFCSTIPMIMI